MRGYRGFLREFSRTGSLRALRLQLQTGIVHVARQLAARRRGDPVKQFFAYYGPDGVTQPDAAARALALDATRCLACGLCDTECARIGGAPPIAPRDAVVSAARLELDWRRLGVAPAAAACGGCDACSRVCPAGIPIERVQQRLATLTRPDATGAWIG
jgi:succinate dehydrogenase/fumarate reductase-like Fe-S protein